MKKGDRITLFTIVALIAISYLGSYIYKNYNKSDNNIAVITQNEVRIKEINLNEVKEPYEFKVKGDKNHYNTIRVEKNRIRVIDGDCPHKECVKSGWLSKTGDMAVCLPNKLTVKIEGKGKSKIDGGVY